MSPVFSTPPHIRAAIEEKRTKKRKWKLATTLDDVLPDDAVIHLPNESVPITGRDVKDSIRRELINIVSTSPLTWDDPAGSLARESQRHESSRHLQSS